MDIVAGFPDGYTFELSKVWSIWHTHQNKSSSLVLPISTYWLERRKRESSFSEWEGLVVWRKQGKQFPKLLIQFSGEFYRGYVKKPAFAECKEKEQNMFLMDHASAHFNG